MFKHIDVDMQLPELTLEKLLLCFTSITKSLLGLIGALCFLFACMVFLFKLLHQVEEIDEHQDNNGAPTDASTTDTTIATAEPADSAVDTKAMSCEELGNVYLSATNLHIVRVELVKRVSRKRNQRTDTKPLAVSFAFNTKRDEKARAAEDKAFHDKWRQRSQFRSISGSASLEETTASDCPLMVEQEQPQAGDEVIAANRKGAGLHEQFCQKLQLTTLAESALCQKDQPSECVPKIEQKQSHPVVAVAAPLKKVVRKKSVRFAEQLCAYALAETTPLKKDEASHWASKIEQQPAHPVKSSLKTKLNALPSATPNEPSTSAVTATTLQMALRTALPPSPPGSPKAAPAAPALTPPAIAPTNLQLALQVAPPASPPASPPAGPTAPAHLGTISPSIISLQAGTAPIVLPTTPLTPLHINSSVTHSALLKRKRDSLEDGSDRPRKSWCEDTIISRDASISCFKPSPFPRIYKCATQRELLATRTKRDLLTVSRKLKSLSLAEDAEDVKGIKDLGDIMSEKLRRLSLEETDVPEEVLHGLRRLSLAEDDSEPMEWAVKPVVKRRGSWPEYESIREWNDCLMDFTMDTDSMDVTMVDQMDVEML